MPKWDVTVVITVEAEDRKGAWEQAKTIVGDNGWVVSIPQQPIPNE